MSRAARILWVSAVSAALCLVALAVLTRLSLEPDGLPIFDSRLMGYSAPEARGFLSALNADQVAQYLGIFRQLDTVFPLLLAFSLGGTLWLNTVWVAWPLRAVLLVLPVIYLICDLSENAKVAVMLRSGVDVSDQIIAQASRLTQIKWVVLGVSMLTCLVVWQWRVRRGLR